MSEWLKIVKKHAQLNKGKSLKEYLPDAKAEYDMLKKSGKIVLKSSKSLKKNKRRKKERKVKRKNKKEETMTQVKTKTKKTAKFHLEAKKEKVVKEKFK